MPRYGIFRSESAGAYQDNRVGRGVLHRFCRDRIVSRVFLPGDSLLFVAGVLASQHIFALPILLGAVFVSAILGNFVGYEFGFRVSEKLFTREDSLFFKKRHAERARAFYDDNCGGMTATCEGTRNCNFNWREIAP